MTDASDNMSRRIPVLQIFVSALAGAIVFYVATRGFVIHVPYLAAVLSGSSMGWMQPQKGWLLTLIQVGVLCLGLAWMSRNNPHTDLMLFSVIGAMVLVLISGLLAGVLKRKLA